MKKILLSMMILLVPILMFGCQKAVSLQESMSEITKIYFCAESEGVQGNISVGERENPYIIDGKHGKTCDFSLIALKFDELLVENQIEVEILINNNISSIILELNPANHFYMVDLGYALKENDEIELSYQKFKLSFINVTQEFAINYNEALKLSETALGDKMIKYYNGENFEGEGYLKVLTQSEKDGLFWVLTLVAPEIMLF